MLRRLLTAGTVASLLVLVPATEADPAPATRQAWQWPFAASSPWNVGIGSGARFAPTTDPRTSSLLDGRMTPWVNAERYSHPVHLARSGDPVATVTDADGPNRYRIPQGVRPAAGSDAHLHVVQPGGTHVEEAWHLSGANPRWSAGHHDTVDLRSSGFGKGTRAAGNSALGGLIRRWELEAGDIRHALAVALDKRQLRRGFVWPASREEGDRYTGGVPLGTYAAIPPSVDLGRLGLTREGLVLGRALKRYGLYVVDSATDSFVLNAEPSVGGQALANLRTDIAKLRPHLRVVANNGPDRVNGGGTRAAAPAPPFG